MRLAIPDLERLQGPVRSALEGLQAQLVGLFRMLDRPMLLVFDPTRFTASGSMVWTVRADQVVCDQVTLTNKMARYTLSVGVPATFVSGAVPSTLSGLASTTLSVALPTGLVADKTVGVTVPVMDNGVWMVAHARVLAGGTRIEVTTIPAGNWTMGATALELVIDFPVR